MCFCWFIDSFESKYCKFVVLFRFLLFLQLSSLCLMLLAEWLIKILLNNIHYYLIHFAACWFKVPPMKSKNTVYFLYMCVCVFDSPLSGSSHWGWLPLRSSSSGRSALGFPSRHIPARCLWTRRRTCWSGSSGTEEALQKPNKKKNSQSQSVVTVQHFFLLLCIHFILLQAWVSH